MNGPAIRRRPEKDHGKAMRPNSDDDWYACPHCGAELATTATFCRECGSSSDSGWSDETDDDYGEESYVEDGYGGDGYEQDDEFDYDEYVRREFPNAADSPMNVSVGKLLIAVIVALTCLAILLAAVL